ncbi:MAG: response regulator [Bacteroidota bacterium]
MKHIVLVEDDAGIQDAAKTILERAGYRVTLYANGDALLEGAAELADLYILDKQLAGVDGLDICRYLKGQPATMHIPVIMLSASPQIMSTAKAAGADAALEKPFKLKELRELVKAHINR